MRCKIGFEPADLFADRGRLRAMQVAARRAAENLFSWEREEPRLLAAVAEALSRPARSP